MGRQLLIKPAGAALAATSAACLAFHCSTLEARATVSRPQYLRKSNFQYANAVLLLGVGRGTR